MHFSFRRIIFTGIAAAMLLCFIANNSVAQQCCQPSVPRLTRSSIPPLNSGMPYNTMIGYIIVDSACRSLTGGGIIRAINSCYHYDSLRYVLKILFAMDDYNPTIFRQYFTYVTKVDTAYHLYPDDFNMAIVRAGDMLGDSGHLLIRLMDATHVLHIRVTSVQNGSGDTTSYWYQKCVTATVVDTFKGRTWLTCSGSNGPTVQVNSPTISFVIQPNKPCHEGSPSVGNSSWDKHSNRAHDPGGNPITNYGDFNWQVGNEYEIFLYENIHSDSLYDYFSYYPPAVDPQGGVFPIINGNVQDNENYFGLGTSVNVTTFESAIRQKIAEILQ